MSQLWVFGYGSLMWNPGFDHEERVVARMAGVHRAPCIYSWVHRGTVERPGIVLGLARGGSCMGVAFRIPLACQSEVVEYLRARELVTNVYLEKRRRARLMDGREVEALTYIADPHHDQYAHKLDHDALLRQIKGAQGKSGRNEDYIIDTADQMLREGIRDARIEKLAKELREN
ncbi:gamma-glutamylcyclotransferase [Pseudahrensia aquimaris]|uniref:glutathione-specific gamma-glutamylcyclotransferase n=1 Tax=Pseudahrensia aquimaris TaxID=744461 RepID=A0ABW3F953_9HYPH